MVRTYRTTFIGLALAAILVLGGALSAQAIPITSIGLTGFVNFVDDSGNPWDITLDSMVTGTAYWDETRLLGGEEVLRDLDDPNMNLEITIGNFSYNFFDDFSFKILDFGFMDGFLRNIFLFGEGPDGDFFDISYDFFGSANVFSLNIGSVTGEVAPVPEPTTILLFATGLAGLAVVGRRRRN